VRGSGVSPGDLLEDELVEGEIRDRSTQSRVLAPELSQAFGLRDVRALVLLAPAVTADLADSGRLLHLVYLLTPAEQHLGLSGLGDDLLGAIALLRYSRLLLIGRKPNLRVEPISGGRLLRPSSQPQSGLLLDPL
jgi:hypothetical protein